MATVVFGGPSVSMSSMPSASLSHPRETLGDMSGRTSNEGEGPAGELVGLLESLGVDALDTELDALIDRARSY